MSAAPEVITPKVATLTADPTAAPVMNSPKCPWGTVAKPPSVSMQEVMDEELAKQCQEKEEKLIGQQGTCDSLPTNQGQATEATNHSDPDFDIHNFLASEAEQRGDGVNDTSSDFLLAQSLQHELNRQHDRELEKQEEKYNGTCKVSLSYNNYRMVHPSMQHCESELQDYEAEEQPESDDSDLDLKYVGGLSYHKEKIVSKHDADISGKRNMNKVMDQFPPNVRVGNFDSQLSNRVYNKLKQHSDSEVKRSKRLHEKKEHSTANQALDDKTSLIVFKLINQEYMEEFHGSIATGKESVVFHASGGSAELATGDKIPAELAVKVFKTTLTDFKNRSLYVKGDVRYFKDHFKKLNPRKVMKMWADKEETNLRRMARFGIPCPKFIKLKKHVLVMEFIGRDRVPAPTLRDVKFSAADAELCYEQCVANITRLYQDCLLVHADLSPYNMLWFNDLLYFIDVSQAVDTAHPQSNQFLLRDCRNVTEYFQKIGVHKVLTAFELFNKVTGLDLKGDDEMFLQQFDQFEITTDMYYYGEDDRKEYPFNYFFDKNKTEGDSLEHDPLEHDSQQHDSAQSLEEEYKESLEESESSEESSEEETESKSTNDTET